LSRESSSDGSDDDLSGEHDDGSVEKDLSSSELVDDPHSGEGHDYEGKKGEETSRVSVELKFEERKGKRDEDSLKLTAERMIWVT